MSVQHMQWAIVQPGIAHHFRLLTLFRLLRIVLILIYGNLATTTMAMLVSV